MVDGEEEFFAGFCEVGEVGMAGPANPFFGGGFEPRLALSALDADRQFLAILLWRAAEFDTLPGVFGVPRIESGVNVVWGEPFFDALGVEGDGLAEVEQAFMSACGAVWLFGDDHGVAPIPSGPGVGELADVDGLLDLRLRASFCWENDREDECAVVEPEAVVVGHERGSADILAGSVWFMAIDAADVFGDLFKDGGVGFGGARRDAEEEADAFAGGGAEGGEAEFVHDSGLEGDIGALFAEAIEVHADLA